MQSRRKRTVLMAGAHIHKAGSINQARSKQYVRESRGLHVGPTISGGRMAGSSRRVLQDQLPSRCCAGDLIWCESSVRPLVPNCARCNHAIRHVLAPETKHWQSGTPLQSVYNGCPSPTTLSGKSFGWLVGRVLMTRAFTCGRL
jgi:hypothetical protein